MSKNKPRIPKFSELLHNPMLMLGFGFGSGLSPKGPGTAGTLLGLLLFLPILLWSEWFAWLVFALALFLGSHICGKSSEYMQVHDHGGIVWDEFVGIWLVLLVLPEQNWQYWFAAFVAFRVFDIWKPWPIKSVDEQVSGGFGIMLDDVLAAFYAIAVIWLAYVFIA
ncbi:phosphatidylglycerophosphatase A [Thiomicrorhabdus immobilis]|uniref:Phosphatidylglycerophosphatase A n=1 Tax=Thiomicrorhabdus immobilis TaxID=2791037 RepID=A0ABN6CX11_9GAMM|nr:phosphatidylglycerophosphatase A [Thiomicrorhabdus immobilis]BCN93583.1 phosphatidylglycerophosphatase A [Thiomicrorhabdus immobilis]